jgi:hypothetical protein
VNRKKRGLTSTKIGMLTIIVLTITSCGMPDKELAVYRECRDSMRYLDIYDKSGKHFTKVDDIFKSEFEYKICGARAKLFIEGYRIKKTASQQDYKIYQLSLRNEEETYWIYKKLIESGIEP